MSRVPAARGDWLDDVEDMFFDEGGGDNTDGEVGEVGEVGEAGENTAERKNKSSGAGIPFDVCDSVWLEDDMFFHEGGNTDGEVGKDSAKRMNKSSGARIPDMFTSAGVLKDVDKIPSARLCMASLWTAVGREMNVKDTFDHIRQLGFKYRTVTSNVVAARRVLAECEDNQVSIKKPRSAASFLQLSETLLHKLKDSSSDQATVKNCIHDTSHRELGDSTTVLTPAMNFYTRCTHISKALKLSDWMDISSMVHHHVLNDMDANEIAEHRENFNSLWDVIDGDTQMKNKILYGALACLFPVEVRDCNIKTEGIDGKKLNGWVQDYWNPDKNGKPTIMYGRGDMRRNYDRYVRDVEKGGWNLLKKCAQTSWATYTDKDLTTRLAFLWSKTLPQIHEFAKSKKRVQDVMHNRKKMKISDIPTVDIGDISLSATFDSSTLNIDDPEVLLKTQEDGTYKLHLGDMLFTRAPMAPPDIPTALAHEM